MNTNTQNLSHGERVYLGRIGANKTVTKSSRVNERPARRKTEKPKADLQRLMECDANFKKWIIEFTAKAIERHIVVKFDKSDVIEFIYLSEPATMDKALDKYLELAAERVDSRSNAGRKPLEEMERQEREALRQEATANQRHQQRERNREARLSRQERDAESKQKLQELHRDRERLQSLQNKTAMATTNAANDEIPPGCRVVKGMFEQKGKTAIQINNKTMIYVKHGENITHAVTKHQLHQKIQSLAI